MTQHNVGVSTASIRAVDWISDGARGRCARELWITRSNRLWSKSKPSKILVTSLPHRGSAVNKPPPCSPPPARPSQGSAGLRRRGTLRRAPSGRSCAGALSPPLRTWRPPPRLRGRGHWSRRTFPASPNLPAYPSRSKRSARFFLSRWEPSGTWISSCCDMRKLILFLCLHWTNRPRSSRPRFSRWWIGKSWSLFRSFSRFTVENL
jgi:hypothetical protein